MQLLLVEDNDIDVFLVQRLVSRVAPGYNLARARNGEEALSLLYPGSDALGLAPPFSMIIDINMPRMNGFELLDRLTDDSRISHIPMYILSTSEAEQDKQQAARYSTIKGYIVKPITEPVFLMIINGEYVH